MVRYLYFSVCTSSISSSQTHTNLLPQLWHLSSSKFHASICIQHCSHLIATLQSQARHSTLKTTLNCKEEKSKCGNVTKISVIELLFQEIDDCWNKCFNRSVNTNSSPPQSWQHISNVASPFRATPVHCNISSEKSNWPQDVWLPDYQLACKYHAHRYHRYH